MDISVVIAVAGNNIDRYTNLMKQLECIKNQTHQPKEVIVVEQSLNDLFYYNQLPAPYSNGVYDYCGIKFKEHIQLFSVAWCRNVGIYKARCNNIVVIDSDYVFDNYSGRKITKKPIAKVNRPPAERSKAGRK
jgi:glycosyltransferase involved in cell wall biosynthesis